MTHDDIRAASGIEPDENGKVESISKDADAVVVDCPGAGLDSGRIIW